MIRTALLATAFAAAAGTAMAQTADTQRSTTTPPAISNPNNTAKTSAAPVAGKNSFTENEARKRLEDNGFAQVTGLAKDADSIWHAKAVKAGKPTMVSLDYQGNITEK